MIPTACPDGNDFIHVTLLIPIDEEKGIWKPKIYKSLEELKKDLDELGIKERPHYRKAYKTMQKLMSVDYLEYLKNQLKERVIKEGIVATEKDAEKWIQDFLNDVDNFMKAGGLKIPEEVKYRIILASFDSAKKLKKELEKEELMKEIKNYKPNSQSYT